jgi:hypothetical protein
MVRVVLEYLLVLCQHKYWVAVEGRKLGLGWWQLFVHDLSKLRPSELFGYAEWKASQMALEAGGTLVNNRGFGMPWFLHTHKRQKHHAQYWVYINDQTGTVDPVEIPEKYCREMLADWRAAQMVRFGGTDVRFFYLTNRGRFLLHPTTRAWLEKQLEVECQTQ